MAKSDKTPVFARLLRYLKPNLGYCVLALLFSAVSVAAALYAPVVIGDAVNVVGDAIASGDGLDWGALAHQLMLLGVSAAAATGFNYLFNIAASTVSVRTAQLLRNDCMQKIQTCTLGYLDSAPQGDIIARIGVDTDVVADGLLIGVSQLFTGITTILGTIGFMMWVDVRTALVVMCLTPISLVVSVIIARWSHKVFRRQSELRGELSAVVSESFANQKLVKLFRQEDDIEARFDVLNRELERVGTQAHFSGATVNPSTRFVNGLVYTAVAVFGALSILRGTTNMGVGQLATFLIYANQYTKPFNEISTVAAELASALASARRVFEVSDAPTEAETGTAILDSVRGDVNLRDVSFGYTPERTLINRLNLDVKAGMRVAIVGPTGCGKSTLINLLMRFYDPENGSIGVDGHDIRTLTRHSLRTSYGMVLQETWLSDSTVAENIAYGAPDATREEIVAAAKAAHAHRFIRLLPQGYDTVLRDGGSSLSAGERQLLCIARVMLLDPPMLILDEATSSIDTRTEKHIQDAFARLTRDKTSFVVAHRFATILDADLILVMRDGDIVEQGTHESLLARGGFYAELYRSQFALAAPTA